MSIPFRKIKSTEQAFELENSGIRCSAKLQYRSGGLIHAKMTLSGDLELDCDVCAETFQEQIQEDVEILLSDGVYSGSGENLDVVEVNSSIIDLNELLAAEIELIRCDYNRCSACQN